MATASSSRKPAARSKVRPQPQQAAVAAGAPAAADEALFYALSAELTGFSQVELFATGVAETYFRTAASRLGPRTFQALLSVAADFPGQGVADRRAAIQRRLYRGEPTRAATRRVLMLWFTGTWFDTLPFGGAPVSAQAYVEGLMWRAIGAHPMAAKPQGFGAWSLPPPADPLGQES